jgi:dTDP-4-amino-4,6-dideoxygalactose transaminase
LPLGNSRDGSAHDMTEDITFNRPVLAGEEIEFVRQAIARRHISGDGWFTRRCSELLERALGVPRVLLTTSCTDALEMCALLLDVTPGDEVVVPSFSFVSTANAFALRGARPVFADIRPDTLNLDERGLEPLLGPRTRAVVVVHYAGVGCEMERILELAGARGIPVVEDNAHGLFARYRGRFLGTFGRLATHSFHETKNFSCGEGGALVLNDASLVERAEILRDKGTDRQKLFRGQVDKYTWVDLGSSFVLSDLLAAFLYAQLRARERIEERRRAIWAFYDAAFRGSLERWGVSLPSVPAHCEPSHHLYHLILPSLELRQRLIEHLRGRGIFSVFHYVPLHLSRMGRAFGGRPGACPVTEHVSERLLRLPMYNDLEPVEQQRVVDEVQAFFQRAA